MVGEMWHFVGRDLDAGGGFFAGEVADAENAQPHGAQGGFTFFDEGEGFDGDGRAVRDAAREAGLGGGVVRGQAEAAGEFAHLGFRETGFLERGEDLELRSGAGAGPEVGRVVGIFAIRDAGEASGAGDGFHAGEEFCFAKIAAVRGVREVVGVLEFGGADGLDAGADFFGGAEGFGKSGAWEAGAVGDDAEGVGAKFLMGYGEEAGAVHAARIGDEQRAGGAQDRAEVVGFFFEGHGVGGFGKKLAAARQKTIAIARVGNEFPQPNRQTDMADAANKYSDNVAGKFFVDDQCIDCDLCRETAPANFKRNDDGGHSYVYKQPETPEEEALCQEALEGCPVEAIGNDG